MHKTVKCTGQVKVCLFQVRVCLCKVRVCLCKVRVCFSQVSVCLCQVRVSCCLMIYLQAKYCILIGNQMTLNIYSCNCSFHVSCVILNSFCYFLLAIAKLIWCDVMCTSFVHWLKFVALENLFVKLSLLATLLPVFIYAKFNYDFELNWISLITLSFHFCIFRSFIIHLFQIKIEIFPCEF